MSLKTVIHTWRKYWNWSTEPLPNKWSLFSRVCRFVWKTYCPVGHKICNTCFSYILLNICPIFFLIIWQSNESLSSFLLRKKGLEKNVLLISISYFSHIFPVQLRSAMINHWYIFPAFLPFFASKKTDSAKKKGLVMSVMSRTNGGTNKVVIITFV